MKKLSDWLEEVKNKKQDSSSSTQPNNEQKKESSPEPKKDEKQLSPNLEYTLDRINRDFGGSQDVVIRGFSIGEEGRSQLAVVFIDGLADKTVIQDFILKTLMIDIRSVEIKGELPNKLNRAEILERFSLTAAELSHVKTYDEVYNSIMSGDSVVLLDGLQQGFSIGTKGWDKRAISEPTSQNVVRGPKEGFTETLRSNTALIRRRIRDTNLRIEHYQIGTRTRTDVAIAYIDGIVTDSVVQEVRDRLKKINVDSILESGYIEELIQDETYTLFPTIYNSERPDAVSAGLLEGRVAIIVDGTPFVLLVPALFVQFFQTPEDYYQRTDISILLRILRFGSFLLALLIPSAYIAVTTFHQEMLPTTLLISLAAQREGVPFPAFVEALFMELTFEILREAGVRMPRAVGSAISIVGALVLGQAAVEAGIVSATMVIVVSLTAMSSFVSPEYNLAISVRILRFGFMLLAASFGLLGIILGIILMITHLVSLRSFGVPYLAPMAPFIKDDQKDAILRFPHWALSKRPRLLNQQDVVKAKTPAPEPDDSVRENQSDAKEKGSN